MAKGVPPVKCNDCGGSGRMPCSWCSGTGSEPGVSPLVPCSVCNGSRTEACSGAGPH
jgi:hypothetical protein